MGCCLCKSPCSPLLESLYRYVVLRMNSLFVQVLYFVSLSSMGFWILRVLKPRTYGSFRPRNIDLFFTSVSATTVSSMSTVEMEVFSDTQLIVLTILMFMGGEVFTSMVGLFFSSLKHTRKLLTSTTKLSSSNNIPSSQIELRPVTKPDYEETNSTVVVLQNQSTAPLDDDGEYLKYNSIKFLGFVVLGYLLVIHVIGVVFVFVYVTLSSAKNVLKRKGLKLLTFSIFTVASTFSNCGYVPTNENMVVFRENSGLLLILLPHILLGNTLFPPCLRFLVWVLGKLVKKVESSSNYLLKKNRGLEIGCSNYLFPSLDSSLLVATVFGFISIQFIVFASLEWDSAGLSGLNAYQKTVGVLFQTMNSRHSGENIVDLSTLSPAILVLFVVMMYLPPYTSFTPIKEEGEYESNKKRRRSKVVDNLMMSQLSYLVIFVIVICITERKKMKEDPLNFNVLNIVVEVVSAYGNVGFSTGYSCARQLKPDNNCQDKWFGFSGKWSDQGKIILIIVMFFGRLKKFNMDGGRAWKLL